MQPNFQYTLSVSLVVYNHSINQLMPLINSINNITVPVKLIVSDNSNQPVLQPFFEKINAIYIFNNANLGYGKAHNKAIKIGQNLAPYHLVINPDVVINNGCIEKSISYLENHKNIGLLMPKVLYPNGEIQHLCKLIPTPFNLIFRRFLPNFFAQFFTKKLGNYELKNKNYEQKMFLHNLSGCFMLMPHSVLLKVGLFDEQFFMYLEDTDLSRRISSCYKAIYYPEVSIVHHYEKGSYKNKKLLFYHIQSAFYYFGKWGWFFDNDRKQKNIQTLNQNQ